MWASSPMVSTPSSALPQPCLPQITIPSTPTTTTTNNQRCFFTLAISNKSQCPPPSPQDNKKTRSARKNIGDLGLSGLAFVESNPQTKPFNNNTAPIKANPKQEEEEQQQQEQEKGKPSGEGERELSGSDVLLALQRASAQKKIKTKKRREYSSSSASSLTVNKGIAAEADNGDVRPVCVKSEWITRLEELEKRLREVMDEFQ